MCAKGRLCGAVGSSHGCKLRPQLLSLFNALVDDERAIVSDQAGTTRDVISQRVTIDGLAVELADTAGLEELQDPSRRAWAELDLHQRLRAGRTDPETRTLLRKAIALTQQARTAD